MKVYFDTEFTELSKDGKLISIGLVSEDGKEFYAESDDIDTSEVSEWILENVLKNTIVYGNIKPTDIIEDTNNFVQFDSNSNVLKEKLTKWLSQFDEVQLYSDVCYFDMVHFINIFGTSFDLPENVSPTCHDINQDISYCYSITEKKAFNISREMLIEDLGNTIIGSKHNSLYDAKVIKLIADNLEGECLLNDNIV